MSLRTSLSAILQIICLGAFSQLPVARDTITVMESGYVKKMPWAGGINYATVSNADLNGDGKNDLVLFDKQNTFGIGRFRCFIHSGNSGEAIYRCDPGLSYFFPQVLNWAIMRDFNIDGKADIFASTTGGIKVYRNVTAPQKTLAFELYNDLLLSNYYPAGTNTVLSNLYAGAAGVPGIADVDGDDDLDILTFTPLGIYLELHRNLSREKNGNSDSLLFQRDDNCWGNLAESECNVSFTSCASQLQQSRKTYHAGACITCIDNDGDGDQDLVMGDMNCVHINYVHNTGAGAMADFTDTTRLYPNYPVKNNDGTDIRISHFPCAYVADADADGKPDLFASPNAIGSENFRSMWLYRNSSITPTVQLQLQQKNFLQEEMIDVGSNAFPLLIDVNADGLKDLLVGTYGYFNNGVMSSSLSLYRNVGVASAPVFSLETRDYLSLGAASLSNLMPAAGDVDGDGDLDLLIGTSPGKVHWLENTAGAGNPCVFAPIKLNPFNFTTPSSSAAPQLFDLDGDGRQDLLIGMKNGRVAYYRNTGTGTAAAFALITPSLGAIDVRADPSMYGYDGYAVPFFYKDNGGVKALVGSVTGDIWQYDVPSASSTFPLMTSRVNGLCEGSQSTVWYEDINGDGKRDLFIGQATGGVTYFSSASPYVGISELPDVAFQMRLSPNPASDQIRIEVSDRLHISGWRVIDVAGKAVLTGQNVESTGINVSDLGSGLYFLEVMVRDGMENRLLHKKLIKCN